MVRETRLHRNKLRGSSRENRILALLQNIGPEISEISRLTGIPKETVRYLYNEHILARRIRVQRELDYERLGLTFLQFLVKCSPDVDQLFDYPSGVFSGLWESVYVHSIFRIIPDNTRLIIHAAPPAIHSRLREFYSRLESLGILSVVETFDGSRLRHAPMWVEDYDCEREGWGDFDWTLRKRAANVDDLHGSESAKFDMIDLQILKHLDLDERQTLTEVSARMQVDPRIVYWHWRAHVLNRRLFRGWRINWLGTHRDPRTGDIPKRRSLVPFDIVGKGLSSTEMMNLRAQLHAVPFLWGEMIGVVDYIAELYVPVNSLNEGYEFIGKVTRPVVEKVRILIEDQSSATTYGIHPELYDDESRQWMYKGDMVLQGIETLSIEAGERRR